MYQLLLPDVSIHDIMSYLLAIDRCFKVLSDIVGIILLEAPIVYAKTLILTQTRC